MVLRIAFSIAVGSLLVGLCVASATAGLDAESNTDGFDPAADSYRINEARRMNAISRQLELNYRMLWWNGFDPANPPIRQPIGYESGQVAPNRWIYRPLYGEEVPPAVELETVPEALPAPVPFGPELIPQQPAPADAGPNDFIPPAAGPREF